MTETSRQTRPKFPLPYGPKNAPSERERIAASWEHGMSRVLAEHDPNHRLFDLTPADRNETLQTLASGIRASTIYWITAETCQLINESITTVPLDCVLTPEILPSRDSVVFFETGLQCMDTATGKEDLYPAISWMAVRRYNRGERHELEIGYYGNNRHELEIGYNSGAAPWCTLGGSSWALGQAANDLSDYPVDRNDNVINQASILEDRRVVLAIIGILTSKGIIDQEHQQITRQQRRQIQRKNPHTNLDAVRIIRIRGEQPSNSNDTQTDSNYNHRWAVKGHWRSQPYGPGRTLRRPTWIAPHIKGPEGAPLLHGEKVYVA